MPPRANDQDLKPRDVFFVSGGNSGRDSEDRLAIMAGLLDRPGATGCCELMWPDYRDSLGGRMDISTP
jgi:hypothetical protein